MASELLALGKWCWSLWLWASKPPWKCVPFPLHTLRCNFTAPFPKTSGKDWFQKQPGDVSMGNSCSTIVTWKHPKKSASVLLQRQRQKLCPDKPEACKGFPHRSVNCAVLCACIGLGEIWASVIRSFRFSVHWDALAS